MGGVVGKKNRKDAYKAEATPETPKSPASPARSSPSVVLEEDRVQFLSKVPLFKRLVRKQLCLIATACTPRDFEASQQVIKQGDVGDEFFLIQGGSASVHVANDEGVSKKVAVLQVGDYFGERALLTDVPRTASIVAETRLNTLQLSREQFRALGLQQELQVAKRKAIGGGAATVAKSASPKTPEERALIAKALHDNFHLQNMCVLDDARIEAMIDFCWSEDVPAGKDLIVEGDVVADYFYVVKEGAFEILQVGASKGLDVSPSSKDVAPARSAEKAATRARSLRALGPGGSFGELALLCHAPRSATVQAMTDSSVWVFDRDSFKNVLVTACAAKIEDYAGYLEKVEMLQELWPSERKIIAEALVEVHFEAGNPIMQEGEPGNALYILLDGEVSVSAGGDELRRMTSDMSAEVHPFFGEKALLNDEPRSATVVAISDIVKTLVLDRTSFDLLIGPLQEILKGNHASQESKPEPAAAAESKSIPMTDLTRVGLLGCGSFGFVDMYEHKVTGTTYALKGQGKGYICMVGAQKNIVQEKQILQMMESPFIIRLYETYSSHDMIYFLLELALGGDLHTAYHRHDLWGSEKHARYYVAGIIVAFVSLHAVKVMYRDLKPENIMLTEAGHCKLTDMGLAKVVPGKTYTCCGTPDYFAPELLQSDGYTHAVDWWTVGVLTFELMSGYAPFEAGNEAQIYRNIRKGVDTRKFPRKWRKVVSDFIVELLRQEPSSRMPMKVGGTRLLRLHKFYEGFNWQTYCDQTMPPPYLPAVANGKDLSNFCCEEDEKPQMVPYVDDGSGWDREF